MFPTPQPEREASARGPLRSRLRLAVHGDEDGMRLDRFLAKRCTWRSRTQIEGLIELGRVELSGRAARPSRKVHAGETIFVLLPPPKRDVDFRRSGANAGLTILFEDESLLAVDKPPGIPVHPGGRLLEDTVITRLHRSVLAAGTVPGQRAGTVPDPNPPLSGGAGARSEAKEESGGFGSGTEASPRSSLRLCHRLDLETSGVLLVAKDEIVAAEMGRQMRSRETTKEYLAIVHGVVREDEFVINAPLGDHPASLVSNRRAVVPGGSASRTGVKVERRFADHTLVRCRLFTGRRHQIRCHLHHVGHPIVGDKVYGVDEELFLAYYEGRIDESMMRRLVLPRQALHAARLVVTHPRRGGPLEVVAPLPDDLRRFLESLA